MLARFLQGLAVASAALVPATAWSQAPAGTALVESFFASLPTCDALEFSTDGYLNELASYYPDLSPYAVSLILDYTETTLPRPGRVLPARTIAPGEILQAKWPRNPVFRQRLIDLARAMQAAGIASVPTRDVIGAAQARLDAGLRSDTGDCYKISQMTGTSDNEWVSIVALPRAVQAQIDALFADPAANPADGGFSAWEEKLMAEGEITLDEARESRAMRLATAIFERNTVLRSDLGGYGGNADFFGVVRTTCRNEMQTYYFFLRRLQSRGLLRHFTFEETWSHRRNAIPIDGHDGTVFRSLRTGQLFVLDSWIVDGGVPANILLLSDWVARRDYADDPGA